jgi:LPS export ABC transporter protein LptC
MSVGVAVLTAMLACAEGPQGRMDEEEGSEQVVESFTLVESDSGSRVWRLDSDVGRYMEEDSIVLLSGVEMTFYESDVPETFLEGDSGLVEIEKGRMRIWGNVRAESADGRVLTAPELLWNEAKGYFRSDCLVTLVVPDSAGRTVMSGRGVKLDSRLGATEGVDIRESFEAVYTGELDEQSDVF